MCRISFVLIVIASVLVGCSTTEQTEPVSAMQAKVLALAEPVIQKHLPEAYHQYKPFTAEQLRNTQLWLVYPASGNRKGVPVMQIRESEDNGELQIQAMPSLQHK